MSLDFENHDAAASSQLAKLTAHFGSTVCKNIDI